jgi:vacuolar-type H+-ATPase subunit H
VALQVIDDIRQAEAEAEAIEQKAAEQARDIIRQARHEADALIAESEKESRRKAVEMLERAKAEAEAEIQPELRANEQRCDQLKGQALSRMDAAVKLILDRLGGT